jgi:hypothetical protein
LTKNFPVALEEGGRESGVAELCVVKITEHALFGRLRHRVVVLRCLPLRGLLAMAREASLAADILSGTSVFPCPPVRVTPVFSLSLREREKVRVPV